MTTKSIHWRWQEGSVNRTEDYFELRYGSVEDSGWDAWLPVAFLGQTQGKVFHVEFLIDAADSSRAPIVEAAKKELSFYLVDKNERDPWLYAQYHCGTSANIYSSIHWSFYPQAPVAAPPDPVLSKNKVNQRFAVFTRNHARHLEDAARVCAADPSRLVTFRAKTTWASAERAVSRGISVPIYIAIVGGPGDVEYGAELCEVQTHPRRGDAQTERLLALTTDSTKDEGLWESHDKPVGTLYSLRNLKKVTHPFPLSTLHRASDRKPLSAEYRYSYALVLPLEKG